MRSESLEYIRTGNIPDIDPNQDFPFEPDTPAAIEYVDSLKPQRYAALAVLIDTVLSTMIELRSAREPYGFLAAPRQAKDLWNQLRLNTLFTADEAIQQHQSTHIYRRAQNHTTVAGRLNTTTFTDVALQLRTGFDTAASSKLTILRNMPQVLAAHGRTNPNLAATARASVGLPWRLAIGNVQQLLAARQTLLEDKPDMFWADIDADMQQDWFRVKTQNDGVDVVGFTKLFDIVLPAGYKPSRMALDPPLQQETSLGELGNPSTTVGCPVTLLSRRLHTMWEWYIDITNAEIWNTAETRREPCLRN